MQKGAVPATPVREPGTGRGSELSFAGNLSGQGHVGMLGLGGTAAPEVPSWAAWLLTRRSLASGELAYNLAAGPAVTTLAQLIAVVGCRWGIEECFQAAKNNTGLDHYQVCSYTGWYRHTTLSMLAHAVLAVLRARVSKQPPAPTSPTAAPAAWSR